MPFAMTDLDPRTRAAVSVYDEHAGAYQQALRLKRPQADVRTFSQSLARGTLVLDAGCGPANHLRLLRDAGAHPIGLDLSHGALREARLLLPRDGLVEASVTEPPFDERTFGGLWCAGGLNHLPRDRWRATFATLVGLVESGPVFLSCLRGSADLAEVDDPILGPVPTSAATEDEITSMLEERGLSDLRVELRPGPLLGRRRPMVAAHALKL